MQARLLALILRDDPVLAVLPPPRRYMELLLKRLVAACEAQGQQLDEDLVEAYVECLSTPVRDLCWTLRGSNCARSRWGRT